MPRTAEVVAAATGVVRADTHPNAPPHGRLPSVAVRGTRASLFAGFDIQTQFRMAVEFKMLDADRYGLRVVERELVVMLLRRMPGPVVDDEFVIEPHANAVVGDRANPPRARGERK